jgi:hypothetical protein
LTGENEMNDEKRIEQAKAAWQAQHVEIPPLYPLKLRALEHAKHGRERSLLEYIGAIVGVILCVWVAVLTEDMLLRAGLVILAVGGLYWLAEWRRRKLIWMPTLAGTAETAIECYRQELARLRDSYRGLWKVQLVTSIPGAAVMAAWTLLLDRPGHQFSDGFWMTVALAAWIASSVWHDADKARRYQQELEALER